MQLLQLFPIP
jgi:hypothetical protein